MQGAFRPDNGDDAPIRFGAFELQVRERRLLQDGRAVSLRARPFDLLRVLVARAGQLVSKDELLELAWPGVVVEENNLQVQVSVLRKLLGPHAIDTVPGFGYRFALPLVRASAPSPRAAGRGVASQRLGAAVTAKPLIGRALELDAISALCGSERLVTILGIGGVGKTRLALAVAERLAPAFEAGATVVELADLRDPALVAVHVARSLGVEVGEGNASDALAAALGVAPRLLVLDSAEHVAEPLAALVASALAAAASLHLLVTSQVPLRADGEQLFRLGPLSLPDADADATVALRDGAVGLFVARAQAADRRFVPHATDLAPLTEICRRLDGLPLAIELAAARVPLLGVRGLQQQLDALDWLSDRGPDRPARQQTLAAMLDWSHGLLSPSQQVVFRRLAVCAGAFTLAQARDAVCEPGLGEGTMLDALGALVDRGLVHAAHENDAPRYRLLEAAREYALRKLAAAGESEVLARASAAYETSGDRAQAGGFVAQSLADYAHALELVERLPEDARRGERELELGLKLGPAVQAILGPAHPRSEALYRMAVERATRRAPDARTFRALWGHWHFLCMCGRNREAAPVADELVRLAPSLANDGLELEAAHAAMTSQDLLGNAQAVVEHARRIVASYDRTRHHALAFAFGGHDAGVCAYGQGAWGAWLVGRTDEALALAADAIRLADTMDDGYSRATGYYYASFVHAMCGDAARFDETARALVAVSREHGLEALVVEAELIAGRARFACGDRAAGVAAMRSALARIEASGDLAFVLVYAAFLADALLATGAIDEAVACLKRALGHASAGQGVFLPEIHRLLAEAAIAQADPVRARLEVARALAIAERQHARSLAARAAHTAARGGAAGVTP